MLGEACDEGEQLAPAVSPGSVVVQRTALAAKTLQRGRRLGAVEPRAEGDLLGRNDEPILEHPGDPAQVLRRGRAERGEQVELGRARPIVLRPAGEPHVEAR